MLKHDSNILWESSLPDLKGDEKFVNSASLSIIQQAQHVTAQDAFNTGCLLD